MTPFPAGSTGPTSSTPSSSRRDAASDARVVGAALADEPRAAPERRDPGRDVGRLAARPEHDPRGRVGAGRERLLEPDDHVEHEVSEAADRHRLRSSHGTCAACRRGADPWGRTLVARGERAGSRKMRTFVIGGLVGASAAAAARRLRPRRPRRETPAGLGAFESAPCYREVSERRRNEGP